MSDAPVSEPRGFLTPLLSFVFINAAVGAALGVAVATAIVLTDTAGIATLIYASSDPLIPLAMLGVGFATLFDGVYSGACIMTLPYKEKSDDRPEPPPGPARLVPIRIRAATGRERGRRD